MVVFRPTYLVGFFSDSNFIVFQKLIKIDIFNNFYVQTPLDVFSLFLRASTVVPDSYSGPRLDGDISSDFVLQLMTHLKDQNMLHKKCAKFNGFREKKIFTNFAECEFCPTFFPTLIVCAF